MVSNGYKLQMDPKKIYGYISDLRKHMQKAAHQALIQAIAVETQSLFDLKNLEMAKYPDKSILGLAEERVFSCVQAVQNGINEDPRYDFRSSIILIENTEGGYYVLFNAVNPTLINAFEKLTEITSYKFYLTKPEKGVSEEENIERGQFWHQLFTDSGWNKRLIGINAQLTVQPTPEEMDPEEVCNYIENKTERKKRYCKNRFITEHVKQMVGQLPIAKIAPSELTKMYLTIMEYLNTNEGKKEYEELEKSVDKGFLSITPDLITLVDASVATQGGNSSEALN